MSVKPGPLIDGQYYHIYTRGNNRENIFIEEKNFTHFIALYRKYVEPVADTYAYCLLRNHIHFLVRIKNQAEQRQSEQLPYQPSKPLQPSQQFSNLLNAYVKAINKAYQRTGSLFQSRFGRKLVTSNAHFHVMVAYIHLNPQRHKFVFDFRKWPYSSYQALISDQPTWLKRDEVISWYGSRDEFVSTHLKTSDWVAIQYLLDDD